MKDVKHMTEEEAAMWRYARELYKFCKKKDVTDCRECIFRSDDCFGWYCKIEVPEDWKISKREV